MKWSAPLFIITIALAVCACASAPPRPATGAETFATRCASCHGAVGEADGPVASAMRVSVPNLRTLSQRNGGEFPADLVTSYIDGRGLPAAHGDRYMPVWGDEFAGAGERAARERIDAVVVFLRELQYP